MNQDPGTPRRPLLAFASLAGFVLLSFAILLNTACGLFRARYVPVPSPPADPPAESRP